MSVPRQPWRETVRVAADVALLGVVVAVAALPVVTAGAAVAAGTAAMHHFVGHDRWPTLRQSWEVFLRGLLPGLPAVAVALGAGLLLTVNLLALRTGTVPGGLPLTVGTAVLLAVAAGYAALTVVALGARRGHGWRAAARDAAAQVADRPGVLPAASGVVLLAGLLGVLVHPVLVPVLAGYALFALHAVVGRTGTDRPGAAADRWSTSPAHDASARLPGAE